MEKIAGASRTRISARAHKDLQRRKNALESSSLPTKLSDCRSEDVTRTELFIVEGDSALGTTKAARNSEYQAILPIRGKILNVQKASLSQMLDDKECGSIIQVIGAGSGKSFELDEARYGRVILMSDADVDGAHIRCLLLTLMYRYMRPMLDAGRVFAAIPPLHRIESLQIYVRLARSGKSQSSVIRVLARWMQTSYAKPQWIQMHAHCVVLLSQMAKQQSVCLNFSWAQMLRLVKNLLQQLRSIASRLTLSRLRPKRNLRALSRRELSLLRFDA
jgi:DNA gyrase/topoisomerase IV subunit B